MNARNIPIAAVLRRSAVLAATIAATLAPLPAVHAGGGPENALIIIDPTTPESLFVGNHYKQARNIPDRNVLYFNPEADNYLDFVDFHRSALLGTITTRALDDHIDYVIIPPGAGYRIPATGLITDPCSPVTRFAVTSTYTMAHIVDDILQGDISQRRNEYNAGNDSAVAFDSNVAWHFGLPSNSSAARRYFIGAMLGYTGPRGNTVAQIIDMIDRSVAADGTRPAGTFYYVQTTDVARSGPRDPFFPAAVQSLQTLGAAAVHLGDGQQNIILPIGHHDALGIMTGFADLDILNADMTILPGAFCDHLTSFAGDFDQPNQTKMSDWITKGASGSSGTVEEPCNFPGKFPHPRMHVYYFQGLSLGEAAFRSLGFVPYQVLLYGDPLTRPFAHIPDVHVDNAPVGTVSGSVTLTPTATTSLPGGTIARFDLLIDGVLRDTVDPGQSFLLDTTRLPDGHHDLRVIAFEDSTVATQGRWLGTLDVNNLGHAATVAATPPAGNLATLFNVDVAAAGGNVVEIRLLNNGRVLAATQNAAAAFPISARQLGAGTVRLVAVADFSDGTRAVSQPATLDIAFADPAPESPLGNVAPVAYQHTAVALAGTPTLIDLPATDADGDPLTIVNISQPAQADLIPGADAFLLKPAPDATGTDTVTFTAFDGQLLSNVSHVTVNYCDAPVITAQPADRETCVGETAVFQVTAVGPNLSYQWHHDGDPIAGATDSVLTIDGVQPDDAGLYTVDVTGACGSITTTVTSDAAILVVPPSVEFMTQPQGETLCLGDTWFTFVTVSGADAFQWFKDGQPIPGATASFLIIQNVGPQDRGTYLVEASNPCGIVPSDPAVLHTVGCGDGDGDGDNDFADFRVFQTCFTGPTAPALPDACLPYDFDGDDDIDLNDFNAFLNIVTPPT